MGRNNIEDRSKDKNWGYNKTQKATVKFELMSDNFTRRFEASQGLMMFKLTMSIRCNAYYKVDMNDELVILGRTLKVTTIADAFDNDNQGMFKTSLDDFTGHRIIGLE